MINFKQIKFNIQMYFSGLPDFLDKYWKEFEEKELNGCKTDKENGRNHCVYERRIYEEKIDEENNSGKTSIFSIIVPDTEYPQKKEILCINAPNGFAKEFFAKRLCLINHDHAETKNGKAWLNIFDFQGRIPIIIKMQDIEALYKESSQGEYEELCLLCMNSMKRFSESYNLKWSRFFRKQAMLDEDFEKNLLNVLSQLLDMGKLFILFEKNVDIDAEELRRIVGFEEKMLEKKRGIRKNLLTFVFDDERKNPFDCGFYPFKLDKLSYEEVMEHIEKSIGGQMGIWQDINRLFDKIPALMIPDCLLFVMETHQNSIQNPDGLETAADLYRSCIEAVIADRVPENIDETWQQLQNHAWRNDEEMHIVEGELGKLMPNPLKRNHLLYGNGQFRFEGCREYLKAETIYNKWSSLSGEEIGQAEKLLNDADGNILRRLIEITVQACKDDRKEQTALNKLLDCLFSNSEEMINVDFDVLIYFAEHTINVENVDCQELFIEFIRGELEKPTYDNRIFDMIIKAGENKGLCAWKVYRKLRKIYLGNITVQTKSQSSEEDRFNRRFLTYCDKYDKLDEGILSGFAKSTLHPHVKYHLARALIDSAINVKQKEHASDIEFFRNAQKFMNNEEIEKDAILRGQRLALKLIFGEMQQVPTEDIALVRELEELLSERDYWKRAHAADTLGHVQHSDIRRIPESLIRAIGDEMERKDEDYKRKKVIGYTAEAVCVFFYISYFLRKEQIGSQDVKELGKELGIEMLRMICLKSSSPIENREFIMFVFVILAEGALYLTNQKYNERPSFSGKHISDSKEQWNENKKRIVSAFEHARSSCNNTGQKAQITSWLREFQNWADKIKRKEFSEKKEIVEIFEKREPARSDIENSKNGLSLIGGVDSGGGSVYIQQNIMMKGKKGYTNMNVNNYASVASQQNIEEGGYGIQMVGTSGGLSIAELKEIFRELPQNICEEKQSEINAVITELSMAVDARKVSQKDEAQWKDQFLKVLSAGASVVTITSAPWWPSLAEKLHQFFSKLPF